MEGKGMVHAATIEKSESTCKSDGFTPFGSTALLSRIPHFSAHSRRSAQSRLCVILHSVSVDHVECYGITVPSLGLINSSDNAESRASYLVLRNICSSM